MVSQSFSKHIASVLNQPVTKWQAVSGGDIAAAYRITTATQQYFLKAHANLGMLQAEKLGLDTIAATNTIATPAVHHCDEWQGNAYLIMDFVETGSATSKDLETLGHQLAQLHQVSQQEFGFSADNFIGSLPQSNTKHNDWATFYVRERLDPQLELALSKNLLSRAEIPSTQIMINACNGLFGKVTPSLLHGDLWSGNYLIASDGTPYLIDPAVYYGHHEIDIAMSRLFGGFGSPFYEAYHQTFPVSANFQARIDLYQLYYLLVHLNLFGRSYYNAVKRIMNTYF